MPKVMTRIVEAVGLGSGKLDLSTLTVENDAEVVEGTKAEAEAVRRAHEAEEAIPGLDATERGADTEYDKATVDGDETAVRDARRTWIAAQEAGRAHREKVKRLQKAATAARQRREQVEQEAETRIAEKLRAAVVANVAETRWHVTGEGDPSKRTMLQLAEEREQIALACESFSPWGSPTARRVGWYAGMGEAGRSILTGRGAPGLGPHALNAVFLEDRWTQGGCCWAMFIDAAKRAGLEV